ncbi:hypothetical protein PRIC1_002346 [Phytophthora ramorum]
MEVSDASPAEDEFDSFQDALPYEEPASLTSSTSTSPADGEPRTGSNASDVDSVLPTQQMKRLKRKERLRTQSESAAWTRASLRMRPSPPVADMAATPAFDGAQVSLPPGVKLLMTNHDSSMSSAVVLGSREGVINMWRQQGQISERASEILEDAKLALHGKERNLYNSSAKRLSEAQDPRLNTLGERISSTTAVGGANLLTEPSSTTSSVHAVELHADDDLNASQVTANVHENAEVANTMPVHPNTVTAHQNDDRPSLDLDKDHGVESSPSGVDERDTNFRPQSATLYHEAVKWEGVLTRRSEWLRRLERHYYVLEDSSSRPNGFTFITEDKKTLQVTAPTAVEKFIWMRLGLEAIVALPTLPVAPLDMEEFYAMLVVLYTAHSGNWRTEGDMAVTLPPPSEQVFTRFFRLLDKDVIFCSNYPPSVPFHGSFRGHAGVVTFMHGFARHTLWTNFKIGGMSVDGAIAVASGKEELENRRDARKFIQNWVHKFTFYSDGRLARFEINGDVVAASAVFKVPGAATTLKLPQEYNEVDAEHGLEGVLLVRVMQGHGLKAGTSVKKTVKEPSITVHLQYREQPKPKSGVNGSTSTSSSTISTGSSTLMGGISMPSLSRKFSFMTSVASSAASAASSAVGVGNTSTSNGSTPKPDPFSTGTPRNAEDESYLPTHPVWNRTTPRMDGVESQLGFTMLNVAKYLMAADGNARTKTREEAAMAADSKWYSISNAKGEYCGKVQLGITCRRSNHAEDGDGVQPRLKKSQSVVIDRKNPPSSHMLQWDATPAAQSQALLGAATPALKKGMLLTSSRWAEVNMRVVMAGLT